jgi:hypothetical protein
MSVSMFMYERGLLVGRVYHRVLIPLPLPVRTAKEGSNHLNK